MLARTVLPSTSATGAHRPSSLASSTAQEATKARAPRASHPSPATAARRAGRRHHHRVDSLVIGHSGRVRTRRTSRSSGDNSARRSGAALTATGGRAVPPRGRRRPPGPPGMPSASRVASTGTLRLIRASAIGPSSWWRAESRRSRPRGRRGPRGAVRGEPVSEPSRCSRVSRRGRPAEGVHPGDRLLAAVAALVEVHGRRRSSRPRWGWCGGRCPGRSAAHRARSGAPRTPKAAGRAGRLGVRLETARGNTSYFPLAAAVGRQATAQLVGDVGDLDPHHEPHPVQPVDERAARRPARRGR